MHGACPVGTNYLWGGSTDLRFQAEIVFHARGLRLQITLDLGPERVMGMH